ncbi:MAG: hypothetical protein RL178_68 [Pseudomonadota bacterium]
MALNTQEGYSEDNERLEPYLAILIFDMLLDPPQTSLASVPKTIQDNGYVVLSPEHFFELSKHNLSEWQGLSSTWKNLPADAYLKDGGRYRQRRHASFVIKNHSVTLAPHRAHWQPVSYNALHGGIDRWFEPCEDVFANSAALKDFLLNLATQFDQAQNNLDESKPWFVEVHQFRIDTTDGIGRPTPEGAHRDGVEYVAVLMLERHGIKGGETRVFESNGPQGQRFTLQKPFSLLLLDDARVVHETTPIQPVDPKASEQGWRDTLVVTYRRGGFQDSPSA